MYNAVPKFYITLQESVTCTLKRFELIFFAVGRCSYQDFALGGPRTLLPDK